MANKILKGFRQVTEGSFEAESGFVYFVRNSSNTGMTDGYILFNGKKYGTAIEVAAELNGKIGTIPNGYSDLVSYIDAQASAITSNYASLDDLDAVSDRVDALEALSAGTRLDAIEAVSAGTRLDAVEALSAGTRLDAIEADYLTSDDKTSIESTIGTLSGRVDALEEVDVDARLEALETLSAGTRISDLEEIDADARLDVLEASAHTHANQDVLDGITQAKVNQWDGMSSGASVILSAYTGSDAGVTEGYLKTYEIFQGGVSVGKIDIPKDLVVSSGQIVEEGGVKYLRLTIANSSTPVDIAVSDLVDAYTPGNGIEISNTNEVSAKVVAGNGLSVDANGIQMAAAGANADGAMSSADFNKLASIEASAQTNVIETVKVNGTALTVTDKAVDIVLTAITSDIEALSGVSADTRIAALEAVSADTRLDALEALSGNSHDHSNKSVLDGISSEDVANWDAAEQNAKDYADGLVDALNADVSGESNGVEVRVVQASGVVTTVSVTAPDFDSTYAPASLSSASTRLDTIEADYLTSSDKSELNGTIGTLSGRVDALEAVSADTRLGDLEAVSADTRLDALEALTGDTSSALQSISAGDASVSVGAKTNNDQSVAVAISSASNNALSLESDGLFAAIYYDGDDSN